MLFSVTAFACSSPPPANQNVAPPPAASVSAPANSNSGNAASSIPTTPPGTGGQINAAAIFTAQKCDTCHGTDGKGKVKGVPNFTDAAWQQKETDVALANGIKKGKVPKMPAYESKLSEAEITALVAYVRTFRGK
jgi:mono/diheme cytochrome c family protein